MTDQRQDLREDPFETARRIFKKRGGLMRTREALASGIHPGTLYAMRDAGVLERLTRGLYRLGELPPSGQPDLQTVALRIPNGVICLISALAYHGITTEVPHEVYLALRRGTRRPKLEHPPVRTFWMGKTVFDEGVETHDLEGLKLKVYSAEKTLADCFKYRNKIGLDAVIEALRMYQRRQRVRGGELLRYAKICRVEKIMRPYLEAIL